MKERMNKETIKIKIFAMLNDTVKRMKRKVTDWEKIFTEDKFDKRLIPKRDKEFLNSVLRGQTI